MFLRVLTTVKKFGYCIGNTYYLILNTGNQNKLNNKSAIRLASIVVT